MITKRVKRASYSRLQTSVSLCLWPSGFDEMEEFDCFKQSSLPAPAQPYTYTEPCMEAVLAPLDMLRHVLLVIDSVSATFATMQHC